MKYLVKRPHIGDQAYSEGDTREADPMTVAHLVKNGVLVAADEAEVAPVKKGRRK